MHQTRWTNMTCSANRLKTQHKPRGAVLKNRIKDIHSMELCWSAKVFHWPGFHHRWSGPGCGVWPRSVVEILVVPAHGALLPLPPAVAANTEIRWLKHQDFYKLCLSTIHFLELQSFYGRRHDTSPTRDETVALSVTATKSLMRGKSQAYCNRP